MAQRILLPERRDLEWRARATVTTGTAPGRSETRYRIVGYGQKTHSRLVHRGPSDSLDSVLAHGRKAPVSGSGSISSRMGATSACSP